ncbi:carboxypeptidase-like regulatory domain-containing protein [Paenibacillus thalictri]|uniref:Carboxypeptidase regulatory-like domain-containing protein n=1 Tax=Paenibacillus thalictri TaxID=2527873 RepID=A0A4Q9DNJ1_9BACL|nr:carboxypeptidase-like regulatory domain-containing protein [Paenibacillus thalictri]TBL75105.1 carboxypeptidase regulatory-like domain-containing protein [Paenibacillus thalictri]
MSIKIKIWLCTALVYLVMPVYVWAGGIVDTAGDGVRVDDIVRFLNNNRNLTANEVAQLTSMVSPVDPNIPGSLGSAAGVFGKISGKIVDSNGGALEGANVTVNGIYQAVSLADGTFVVNNVPASFKIQASVHKDGFADVMTNSFNIISGAVTPLGEIRLSRATTGTLTGTIVNYSGLPVSAASVQVTGVAQATYSDSLGKFRFDNLETGLQNVKVTSSVYGSAEKQVEIIAGVTTDTTVQLPGGTGEVVQYGALQGTVYNAEGMPIANAQLSVTGSTYTAISGVNGTFYIDHISPGAQMLSVSAATYITNNRIVNITANNTALESIYLIAEGQHIVNISGQVVASNYAPVSGVKISFKYLNTVRTAQTNANGIYTFPGVISDRTYELTAEPDTASGFVSSPTYSFKTIGEGSLTGPTVILLKGSEVTTVTGIVSDYLNNPLPGAKVQLCYFELFQEPFSVCGRYFTSISDSAGRYTFPNVLAGSTISLTAWAEGAFTSPKTGNINDLEWNKDINMSRSIEVSTLSELAAAAEDQTIGQVVLKADISTPVLEDNSYEELYLGYLNITGDSPHTLKASEFYGNPTLSYFDSGQPVINIVSVAGDSGYTLQNALSQDFVSTIEISDIEGYSGVIRSLYEPGSNYKYFALDAAGGRIAFIGYDGLSLQAALNDPLIDKLYITSDVYVYGVPLTFPSRNISLLSLSDTEMGETYYIMASAFVGYDAARVTLADNVFLLDHQPPIVTSITNSGNEVTIQFNKPVERGFEGEGNPWQDKVYIVGGETPIKYQSFNAYELSNDQKQLKLRFSRELTSGDRLLFSKDIRSVASTPIAPIVYENNGAMWSAVPDIPGNTVLFISPMGPFNEPIDYFEIQGTASDPDGFVYIGEVRFSFKNSAGLYLTQPSYMFDSNQEFFIKPNQYPVENTLPWSFGVYFNQPVPNGVYTIHVITEKGDSKLYTFTVAANP